MAFNDDVYAALLANGFQADSLNIMEAKFWAVMRGGVLQNYAQPGTGAPITAASTTATATGPGIYLIDATAANATLTLPTAASSKGKQFVVKKVDASVNTVTIQANGAELIDGTNTKVLSTQWTTLILFSNGTAWYIMSNA